MVDGVALPFPSVPCGLEGEEVVPFPSVSFDLEEEVAALPFLSASFDLEEAVAVPCGMEGAVVGTNPLVEKMGAEEEVVVYAMVVGDEEVWSFRSLAT